MIDNSSLICLIMAASVTKTEATLEKENILGV
jgi:hypothetical protein